MSNRDPHVLAAVRLAREQREDAERRYRDAIVTAHRDGFSVREIAPAASLGPTRTHRIISEATEPAR